MDSAVFADGSHERRRLIRREIRRRRPHLLIACVVTGLALAPAGAVAVVGACTVSALVGAVGVGRSGAMAAILLLPASALFAEGRIEAIDRPATAAPPGSRIEATATLLERPRPGLFGSSAPMRIESGRARGLRILARRDAFDWPATDPGTRFQIEGFVRVDAATGSAGGASAGGRAANVRPTGSVPSEANAGVAGSPGYGPLPPKPDPGGEFDYAAFLRSRGIAREVEIESLRPVGRRGGVAGLVDSMRRRAEDGIGAGLSRERASLARGLNLGEDGDVADSTRDDFRRAGLAYLLAASGQNVALLCALALPLLIALDTTQRVRVAVLLPLVGIYVALAGSGASVTRAGIMAAAGLVAIAASRRSSAAYSLLLAAAITLALNPRCSGDPGWQLSFAAVLGMLVIGPPLARRMRRLPKPVAEALGATTAATLASAPLLAHQFGAVSTAAFPANLIVFPAVAPIMWIGMSEAALEQFAPIAAPLTHGLEHLIAPVQSLGLRWVAGVATRFADPGWAQAKVHLGWPAVVAAYALLAGLLALLPRLRGAVHRLPWLGETIDWAHALAPARRRALTAGTAALALAGVAEAAAPTPVKHLTVDFIDVGQGDSTLIRDATGAAVLFDGGVPEARVDRSLKRLGVRQLSLVVATHQSRDHHAGLLQVVRRFRVGLFLDGRDGVDDPSFIALEHEVDKRHIPRRPVRAGERLRVGGMTIRILWPAPRGDSPPPADPNERAAVAIVSEGGFDLFLSADAEAPVLLPLNLPEVDAMKVPHHGSAETGLPELLRRLRPKVAAIETGRGNRYGHPRASTLNALRSVPGVFRTDRDGTIELTVKADRIAIRTPR